MSGLPILDAELLGDDGRPTRFTFLDRGAWDRVYKFFGGVVRGELYLAILYLRVMARYKDQRQIIALSDRSRLARAEFFDPEVYEAKSTERRLAAAISWAIATYNGQDPETVSADHRAVAFCLATPMAGGEL